MPTYLTSFTHTPATWTHLTANPEDRRAVLGPLTERVGGRLIGLWYALADVDGYVLFEAPDDRAAAAVLSTVAAGGAMATVRTTRLLEVEEMLEAWQTSASLVYRAPGAARS